MNREPGATAGELDNGPSCWIRARRPDGSACTVALAELEAALSGAFPSEAYLLPKSGLAENVNCPNYFWVFRAQNQG